MLDLNQKLIKFLIRFKGVAGGTLVALGAITIWYIYRSPAEVAPVNRPIGQWSVTIDFGTVRPLPQRLDLSLAKVTLGKRLFHDVRLSRDDTIGCASCHDLKTGGVDRRVHSIGVGGSEGGINAPTVFNSGFNVVQFWDGRAATLEEQIDGPVHNPKEMASAWPQIIAKLSADSSYLQQFASLYRDGITSANIKDAIATFERSLITPDSRFDRYLRGESGVLSEQEKQGYTLFQSYGCVACHQGINLGGNMFEKMGLMGDYFADRGNLTDEDLGRFRVNHDEQSKYEFRVPSLRNVARTAPYFHDGSAKTLRDAVQVMAKYQLGRPIPPDDTDAIVSFLETLTGEYNGAPL